MMKNASTLTFLSVILFSLAVLVSGCAQLGETKAEASRRHKRVFRINRQAMMADIDTVMLTDQPSKLTGKRLP